MDERFDHAHAAPESPLGPELIELVADTVFKSRDLTPEEHRLVRTHVLLAGRLISSMGLTDVGSTVAALHARFDGTGVPAVAGHDIRYTSRMLAIANAFETILDSLGRGDAGLPAAVAELRAGRGTAFDPDIVDCLLSQLPHSRTAVP